MDEIRFTWDPAKAAANRLKHGVTFEEAESAFADEVGLLLGDLDHSLDEDRYLLLGMSDRIRVLVVSHAVWAEGDEIRIISARRATKAERRQYVEGMRR